MREERQHLESRLLAKKIVIFRVIVISGTELKRVEHSDGVRACRLWGYAGAARPRGPTLHERPRGRIVRHAVRRDDRPWRRVLT